MISWKCQPKPSSAEALWKLIKKQALGKNNHLEKTTTWPAINIAWLNIIEHYFWPMIEESIGLLQNSFGCLCRAWQLCLDFEFSFSWPIFTTFKASVSVEGLFHKDFYWEDFHSADLSWNKCEQTCKGKDSYPAIFSYAAFLVCGAVIFSTSVVLTKSDNTSVSMAFLGAISKIASKGRNCFFDLVLDENVYHWDLCYQISWKRKPWTKIKDEYSSWKCVATNL